LKFLKLKKLCVRDPTYISGCKPQSYEPVLWGWVRLKVHFRNMVSESSRAYPSEYLLDLSGHPLSFWDTIMI